jgi:hypothetical protein
MIAQLILTTLLSAVALYAYHERKRSPAVSTLSLTAALAGVYLVWVPAHASVLADWAGVGRGVDLIMYILGRDQFAGSAQLASQATCTT